MPYLDYIDDDILISLVKDVLDIGRSRKETVEKNFNKNVIDPFASLFDAAVSEVNHETWKNSEKVRQCQKTLTNHIGNLHQKILGNVDGWADLGTGGVIDLVCHDRKIIAEVKNKFNTVTGSKLADQYRSLEKLITPKASQYKNYKAYFVNIIPKKPERYDTYFEPSDNNSGIRCPQNENIRLIDGASFYTLVTGKKFALQEFYCVLPCVIEDIFRTDYGVKNFTIQDKDIFSKYFFDAYFSSNHDQCLTI
ncbi:Eco47II family restriction endonuclease [Francisella uliginis]|uniref:Restriction endonuclease n=1 Tax=Francisella uliginis TaxID=573570 RepID=A0A1L4BRC7_9GAMM|nr:Eco47II family restriction endonuclease [Francisella uliginis]API86399.1 restriction endonuclease [Francisella uliginis]